MIGKLVYIFFFSFWLCKSLIRLARITLDCNANASAVKLLDLLVVLKTKLFFFLNFGSDDVNLRNFALLFSIRLVFGHNCINVCCAMIMTKQRVSCTYMHQIVGEILALQKKNFFFVRSENGTTTHTCHYFIWTNCICSPFVTQHCRTCRWRRRGVLGGICRRGKYIT